MRPDGHESAPNTTRRHLIGCAAQTVTLLVGIFITGSFISDISESILLTTFADLVVGIQTIFPAFSISYIFLEPYLCNRRKHEYIECICNFSILLYRLRDISRSLRLKCKVFSFFFSVDTIFFIFFFSDKKKLFRSDFHIVLDFQGRIRNQNLRIFYN